jgi:hypothetical protein
MEKLKRKENQVGWRESRNWRVVMQMILLLQPLRQLMNQVRPDELSALE